MRLIKSYCSRNGAGRHYQFTSFTLVELLSDFCTALRNFSQLILHQHLLINLFNTYSTYIAQHFKHNTQAYVTEARANPWFSSQVQSTCLCALPYFSPSTKYMYFLFLSILNVQSTSTWILIWNQILRYTSTRFF